MFRRNPPVVCTKTKFKGIVSRETYCPDMKRDLRRSKIAFFALMATLLFALGLVLTALFTN